jgi:hypothetical protein
VNDQLLSCANSYDPNNAMVRRCPNTPVFCIDDRWVCGTCAVVHELQALNQVVLETNDVVTKSAATVEEHFAELIEVIGDLHAELIEMVDRVSWYQRVWWRLTRRPR